MRNKMLRNPRQPTSSITAASKIVSSAEVLPTENEKSSVKESCPKDCPANTESKMERTAITINPKTAAIILSGLIR